ncbi:MAG: hypothetical protein ACE1Z6_08920, partial [Candidatus Methylomirabilales bacterium]
DFLGRYSAFGRDPHAVVVLGRGAGRAAFETPDFHPHGPPRLRPEWGNDYEANIARAFNYVQTQPDEFQDLLGDERLLGNHPDIIRRMYELSLRELDPEEEMQAIYKLRRHPYLDRGHPAHRAEVARLHKRRQTPSKGKPTRPQAADEDVYVII